MTGKNSKRQLPPWMTGEDPGRAAFEPGKSRYFTFPGNVKYCSNVDDMGIVCEELIARADREGELILGLDAEWPVTFNKSDKVALIQVCADELTCYLFHISRMRSLPKIFQSLIQHPNVRLVGSCVQNDIWKLSRDYNFLVSRLIGSGNVINLSDLANDVLECGKQTWSLQKLALLMMSVEIDKSESVRKSRWDLELSREQQLYAATDAYVSLVIYNKLKEKQITTK